jgi:cell division protein FtsL
VTTIAAPPRRARTTARGSVARIPARTTSSRTVTAARAKSSARAAARTLNIGRLGALLALLTVFTLVTAVVFHVFLAQHQLELDSLNTQIAKEQRTYEQRSLTESMLASPQRIIQEAQRLGLVLPDEPAPTLIVPNAPLPKTDDGSTADTLKDWSNTKASLGPEQP